MATTMGVRLAGMVRSVVIAALGVGEAIMLWIMA